ncbi:MAG: hypothetical protein H7837_03960 [Magnetococcus sp. MYC-9]
MPTLPLPDRRAIALLLLSWAVAGCAELPRQDLSSVMDPSVTKERFHADRLKRLEHVRQWQVSGILEVTSHEGRRRYRTEVQGEAAQRVKVTLFGLLQQVAGILFADPDEIRMVDAEQQQIIEVPSTAAGLNHLIGIGLQPEELFESMIGLAGPVVESEEEHWLTLQGEALYLEESGLIRERSGQTETGDTYRVLYQWAEPGAEGEAAVPMPTQIHVLFSPGKTEVKFSGRQWQLLDQTWPDDWFTAPEALYTEFTVDRPFSAPPRPRP